MHVDGIFEVKATCDFESKFCVKESSLKVEYHAWAQVVRYNKAMLQQTFSLINVNASTLWGTSTFSNVC